MRLLLAYIIKSTLSIFILIFAWLLLVILWS